MNRETWDEGIHRIDDILVAEAAQAKHRRIKTWRWAGAVAAVVALVGLGAGLFLKPCNSQPPAAGSADGGTGGGTGGASGNYQRLAAAMAQYPSAYEFEDYDTQRAIREENPVEDSFLDSVRRFGYRTGSALLAAGEENRLYSPISLYYALALAASGAEGETQSQLFALLNVEDTATLERQCSNLYRQMYTDHSVTKLRIANSLWLDNQVNGQPVTYQQDYLDTAVQQYYASLFSVDFSQPDAAAAMAQWVEDNTNGLLSRQEETDPQQMLSILNTIYFYDEWIDRFDASKNTQDTFTLADGKTVICEYMNRTYGSHGFFKGDGYTASSLGLKGAGSMVFILPDEGVSTQELLASPERLEQALNGGTEGYGKVVWQVPKFSFGSRIDLKEGLEALGVTDAFSRDCADFSGITQTPAYLSSARQDAHIAIDENGVEAAAFTELAYAGAGMPEDEAEMILNRPFLFAVTSNQGVLLFLGVCADPTAS